MKHGLRYLYVLTSLISASTANATMPSLSERPNPATVAACQVWAGKQAPDTIDFWGTQENGEDSRDLGLSRLLAVCIGDPVPEIVAANSSAGAMREYCSQHQGVKLCKESARSSKTCKVNDPTPTPLNYRTAPNGPILGALPNGTVVTIADTAADQRGKAWVFLKDIDGMQLGWVFRAFVHCE